MEELDSKLGDLTFTWATAGTTPAVQRIQIPSKSALKALLVRMSGSFEQSVGVCSYATPGCSELIKEIRLLLNGQVRRAISGSDLYELNRIFNGGAQSKTDPDTSVAAGKAFAVNLDMSMAFGDLSDELARNLSLLDLGNYGTAYLEVEMNPFSAYASGNTQGSMTATVTISTKELPGLVRPVQCHAELLLVQTQSMVSTSTVKIPLNISKTIIRGLLLKCGTLAATPRITATSAISLVGVSGKYLAGGLTTPKAKLAPGHYQAEVGAYSKGISLTAGYLWLDFANDRNPNGLLVGKKFADLNLDLDITGTPSTTLEVRQYCMIRG